MGLPESKNRRILIVDDNEAIHNAFRKVLNGVAGAEALDALENSLFDTPVPAVSGTPRFEIDSAYQGAEALERIRQSLKEDKPYALVFVDVRMPPGWDGVETLYQIWKEDPSVQAVICSAFSDYSWEQITSKVGHTDQLLVLKKPFDNIEARQMAFALTEKWNLARESKRQMEELDAGQQTYKRLAAENEQLYRDAQAMNRMKDEFLATLSHEMRTPLTSILGWSQILLRGRPDEASMVKAIETIERNARAQTQLVDDLLDVSRIITGKLRLQMTSVQLAVVVRAALDALAPAATAKQLTVSVSLEDGMPPITGDAGRLQQIVWNLMSNSVKFTPAKGRIDVALRCEGQQAVITVADTGIGISAQHLPHLFERFFQADTSTTRSHGGLGLGLALVRHLVELHGGTARMESAGKDKGAKAFIVLPISTTTAAPAAAVPVQSEQMPQAPH